jgi:hypothetical protein
MIYHNIIWYSNIIQNNIIYIYGSMYTIYIVGVQYIYIMYTIYTIYII